MKLASLAIAAVAAVALLWTAPAAAQSGKSSAQSSIDNAVAAALHARGLQLRAGGDHVGAKKMFIESLERSPKGPTAAESLAMLRATNRKLGIADRDDGRPGSATSGQPMDPYGGAAKPGGKLGEPVDPYGPKPTDAPKPPTGGDPLDPYGPKPPDSPQPPTGGDPLDPYGPKPPQPPKPPAGSGDQPVDPYAGGHTKPSAGASAMPNPTQDPAAALTPPKPPRGSDDLDSPTRGPSRSLMVYGGVLGLATGFALAGPLDDNDDFKGASVAVGLAGAGAGAVGAYFYSRKRPMTRGQAAAFVSAGSWGGYNMGLIGDIVTGEGSETNTIYKFVAAGGILGSVGGALLASKTKPSEGDVALVDSVGVWGTTAGLMIGVGISPPRAEGYSLNGVLGSLGGIGAGYLLAKRFDPSKRRMLYLNLGAAAGFAASWVLLYPVISDGGTNNDEQAAGLISTLTMGGGIALTWYLTRNMDSGNSADDTLAEAPVPGLFTRSSTGTWSLGTPLPRPVASAALGGYNGGLGLDLAAGHF